MLVCCDLSFKVEITVYGCRMKHVEDDYFMDARCDVTYFRLFVELLVLKWSVRPRVRAFYWFRQYRIQV